MTRELTRTEVKVWLEMAADRKCAVPCDIGAAGLTMALALLDLREGIGTLAHELDSHGLDNPKLAVTAKAVRALLTPKSERSAAE
jgi:hypothetical protein